MSDLIVSAAKDFFNLPKRAQSIALIWMLEQSRDVVYALMEAEECESPIEKIMSMAFSLERRSRGNEMSQSSIQDGFSEGYVIDIYPQFELEANGNNYRVDFYIYAWHTCSGAELNLVIECDGHDYHHATKEQVQHDNEREYDLKMAGMDVLRFSGSQIFNKSMKCAKDVFDYIEAKVGPEEEEDGDLQDDSDGVLVGSGRN